MGKLKVAEPNEDLYSQQLEYLMKRFGAKVFKLAYYYLKDRQQAEDITQEVFCRVYQNLDKFRSESSYYTWIYRITVNLCKDYLRSAYFRRIIPWSDFRYLDNLQKAEERMFEAVEGGEIFRRVMDLPLKYRTVLALYYFEEMTTQEIGEVLNLKENAVRTRLSRARNILREILGRGRLLMDDTRLEELLQEAKAEAEHFFGTWDPEACSQKVKAKIIHERSKQGLPLLNWGKLAIALACLLVVLHFPSAIIQNEQFTPQKITLDEREPAQLVNFIPVSLPGQTKNSLLVVLWGRSSQGKYEVVYSSLFNDSVVPRPVYTLDFPGTPYKMALLSSQDDEQRYLHYRLIGYTDQSIDTILAEDYVLGGKLDVEEGKMVEEREDGSVTHIVPYQIDEKGDLTLSADQVQLQLGEELLLIGLNLSKQVNLSTRKDILQEVELNLEEDIPKARFTASNVGEERVLLIPNSNPAKSKTLYIRVVR